MATSGKRPFWLHQTAEYLIGAVFIAQGLQSPTPVVPATLGGLVMLNTACARGTMSAFRVFSKRIHRLLDAVLICLTAVAVVQPFVSIDNSTRLIMAVLAFVLAFIWVQSDFSDSPRELRAAARVAARRTGTEPDRARDAPSDGSTADAIGRAAGRLAGKGVQAYRDRKQQKR